MSALAKLDQTKQLSKHEHWTAGSPLRMMRWVAFDFIAQLESRIEEIPGFTHGELAKRLSVSLSRVSQVMNSPGNFTIKNAVVYANAVERNVAVVVYPVDPVDRAPISGDVFRACWEIAGRPKNMFDIQDNSIGLIAQDGRCGMAAIGHTWGTLADLTWNCTAQTDQRQRLIACVPVETPTIAHKGTPDQHA